MNRNTNLLSAVITRLFFVLLFPSVLCAGVPNTVIGPLYDATNSLNEDSSGASTPERTVDDSGMSVPLLSGVRLSDVLSANHIANMAAGESWRTNAAADDYFLGLTPATSPRIVYDLHSVQEVTRLYFWQFQGNGGAGTAAGNGVKTIEVRYSSDPTDFSGSITVDTVTLLDLVTLNDPMTPGWDNTTQVHDLAGAPRAAQYIELTIIDNFFGEPGLVGGTRVGLGEFRVGIKNDPAVSVPALVPVISTDVMVRVRNRGDLMAQQLSCLEITEVRICGTDAGRFMIVGWDPAVPACAGGILAGGYQDLLLTFNPVGFSGPLDATIEFDTNDTALPLSVPCVPPPPSPGPSPLMGEEHIAYSTLSVERDPWILTPPLIPAEKVIGPYPNGVGPQKFTVDIWNSGDEQTLYISDLDLGIIGYIQRDFSLAYPTIAPGETSQLELIFDPGGGSPDYTSIIWITNTDSDDSVHEVTIVPEVLDDPELTVPDPVVAPVTPGLAYTTNLQVELKNLGTEGTEPSFSVVDILDFDPEGPFGLPIFSMGVSIPFTESGFITVPFSAPLGAKGFFTATLLVTTENPAMEFQVELQVLLLGPVELEVEWYDPDDDSLALMIHNVPPGQTWHLESSADGIDFVDMGKPDIEGLELGELIYLPLIEVYPGTNPTLLIQAVEGPGSP